MGVHLVCSRTVYNVFSMVPQGVSAATLGWMDCSRYHIVSALTNITSHSLAVVRVPNRWLLR
jgi:hypothetical protein